MKAWIRNLLGSRLEYSDRPLLLLDPQMALNHQDCLDLQASHSLFRATDWKSLRQVWDIDRREWDDKRFMLVLQAPGEFTSQVDLPWDISKEADVVQVGSPIPPPLRPLYSEAGIDGEAMVQAWKEKGTLEGVLGEMFGIPIGSQGEELAAAIRIRHLDSPVIWSLLATAFHSPLAKEFAESRGDLARIQAAWLDWLRSGETSPYAKDLLGASAALIQLLSDGLLPPATHLANGVPSWTRVGAGSADPRQAILELLPTIAAPADFEGWAAMASTWGQIRQLIARQTIDGDLRASCESTWTSLNSAFETWVRSQFGFQLQSSASIPRGVHKVAGFLAGKVAKGRRVLLLVLDGMGFAQWHQIRSHSALKVGTATACLAMIPTMTEVSRQSLLSGKLPSGFPESLATTNKEEQHWRAFWTAQGLQGPEIGYRLVLGDKPISLPSTATRVSVVIISAIDHLLHESTLIGDRQLSASINAWLETGILRDFIHGALQDGQEIWVTSDHGNLECQGGALPKQGDLVEQKGDRYCRFPSDILRKQVEDRGIPWEPPGYPSGNSRFLFARGRDGFFNQGNKVAHGGLALDEVMVPLVQVID